MAPTIELYARNMEVTERISSYVNKKMTKLSKFLNGIDDVRVDLAYVKSAKSQSDRQVAQITIRGKGFILRSEERADDLFAAIDLTMDKIQRQIERFKGKRQQRVGRGDGVSISEVLAETHVEEPEEEEPVIARRKQFVLTPMDEMEAIEQMTLLGHENFFVFYNGNTNAVSVLYKRRDGTFGLIEPRLG